MSTQSSFFFNSSEVGTTSLHAGEGGSSSITSAGFDAIFQLRSDLLQQILSENLEKVGLATLSATTPYDANALPDSARQTVTQILATSAAVATGSTGDDVGAVTREPTALQVRVRQPRLVTLLAPDPRGPVVAGSESRPALHATVEWTVELNLIVNHWPSASTSSSQPATPATVARSLIPGGFPELISPGKAIAPKQRTVPLAQATAFTSAQLEIVSRPDQFKTRAQLEFFPRVLSVESGNGLFNELLEAGIADLIDEAFDRLFFVQEIALTPHLALGGALRAGETLAGLQSFRVVGTVTTASSSGMEVLSLCVNVGDRDEVGNAELVSSIVADRNFAYYVTEDVIQSVIRLRWDQLNLPEGFVTEFPVELGDPADPDKFLSGRARIRLTLRKTLSEVALVTATSYQFQDALRLIGEQEVQLLKLWNEDNQEISDLGDLGDPAQMPLAWRIQVFDPNQESETTVTQFFGTIARYLLKIVYRPTIERMVVRNMKGVTSSPVGIMILRGDMERSER